MSENFSCLQSNTDTFRLRRFEDILERLERCLAGKAFSKYHAGVKANVLGRPLGLSSCDAVSGLQISLNCDGPVVQVSVRRP